MSRISVALKKRKILLTAIGAGALLTFVLQQFDMNLMEAYLYDFRMRHKGAQHTGEHTVLVQIDDETVDQLDELSPLPLRNHVALLRKIGEAKPKGIGYLVNFNETEPTPETADAFKSAAESLASSGVPVWLGTDVDVTGEVAPPYPLSKIPHRISMIHKDGTSFAEDKVTRRALVEVSGEPTLHLQLAALHTGTLNKNDYRGVYPMPNFDGTYFLINFTGPTQTVQAQGGRSELRQGGFRVVSAIDLFLGNVKPEVLRDKIVIVGTESRTDSNDFVYTPYSRALFANPKLVAHANIIETLIHDNAIVRASRLFDVILTFVLTSLVIALVFRTSPVPGVLATVVFALVVLGLALAAFRWGAIWIHLSHPLLGVFFAYYLFVPYRLIMEYEKRWEFQKKHELLLQVEELKGNFMSLITHDLKTPVARIQGMAEILGRSGADQKIVSEILGSTDELNRFITSILELARIESARIKVNRVSKDINRIIEEAVQKFAFQAQAKRIRVDLDLEPMFPISVDAALISKVVSNLVDNAIKYSPEGTAITVRSRETSAKPGFVEVTIADTGHGIPSREIGNLFARFYRPKNDQTIRTKGTGLGLYLSRYFVELHDGSLTVDSEEGKGSVFTIQLPVDTPQAAPLKGEESYV